MVEEELSAAQWLVRCAPVWQQCVIDAGALEQHEAAELGARKVAIATKKDGVLALASTDPASWDEGALRQLEAMLRWVAQGSARRPCGTLA